MRVLAVDPGYTNGGVAIVDGDFADVFPLPVVGVPGSRKSKKSKEERTEVDYKALKTLIASLKPDVCILELVGGRQTDAPHKAFYFGYANGVIKCAMQELCDDVRTVAPGAWKRAAMIFRHEKAASIDEAEEPYPQLAEKIGSSTDMADALLIAHTQRELIEGRGE